MIGDKETSFFGEGFDIFFLSVQDEFDMADTPEVKILLLGDAECGKTTFLS